MGDAEEPLDDFDAELEAYEESLEGEGTQSDMTWKTITCTTISHNFFYIQHV